LTKFVSDKEVKEVEDRVDAIDPFTFQTTQKDTQIKKEILDYKIQTLRPLNLLDGNGWKMILVYLPTKVETVKGSGESATTTYQFVNTAYFVISKPKMSLGLRRTILSYDHQSLVDKYRITVLSHWNDTRWDVADLKSWIKQTKPTDPTKLYKLLDETIRKYIEFDNNPECLQFNLWNIGTYFYQLFPAYPYNDFTGTKRSGKTKKLEFQKLVCYNAIMSIDITSSAFFRIIEGLGCVMLLDETEEFKNKNNDQAQAVRNVLMQGYLREQHAIRNETSKDRNFTPTQFNLYSPKSLAHINAFDDVLEERCIDQVSKRALDLKIRNTWATEKDPSFSKIRRRSIQTS